MFVVIILDLDFGPEFATTTWPIHMVTRGDHDKKHRPHLASEWQSREPSSSAHGLWSQSLLLRSMGILSVLVSRVARALCSVTK